MKRSQPITSENVECKSQALKRKKKDSSKVKIPQNLIENRRREIISSLDKVTEDSEVVIESIPRVYTGSKRGSNFRGVSVNGKKWQVWPMFFYKIFTTYVNTVPNFTVQVMVMGFGKKRYYGGIKDETDAAKLYDKYAILTQGVGVRF